MTASLSDTDFSGVFAPRAQSRAAVPVHAVAFVLAMIGGLVLVGITLMTVVSITGLSRFFGWAPALAGLLQTIEGGYYELVQAGTAFAVFAFLPWCQLKRGHVTVDIFVLGLGRRGMAFLALVGNVLLTIVSGVIFWRLVLGTFDKARYQETTFILQFPVWWAFAVACVGAAAFVLVSFYTVWRSLNEVSGMGEKSDVPTTH